jgi:hypothetical protein
MKLEEIEAGANSSELVGSTVRHLRKREVGNRSVDRWSPAATDLEVVEEARAWAKVEAVMAGSEVEVAGDTLSMVRRPRKKRRTTQSLQEHVPAVNSPKKWPHLLGSDARRTETATTCSLVQRSVMAQFSSIGERSMAMENGGGKQNIFSTVLSSREDKTEEGCTWAEAPVGHYSGATLHGGPVGTSSGVGAVGSMWSALERACDWVKAVLDHPVAMGWPVYPFPILQVFSK